MHSQRIELHIRERTPEGLPSLEELCQHRESPEKPQPVEDPYAIAGTALRDCSCGWPMAGQGHAWRCVAYSWPKQGQEHLRDSGPCILGQRHLWGIVTQRQPLPGQGDLWGTTMCGCFLPGLSTNDPHWDWDVLKEHGLWIAHAKQEHTWGPLSHGGAHVMA